MKNPFSAISSPNKVLGIKRNWSQFSLLVVVNSFVGAMVGMERSILPAIAEEEFHLVAHTAILAFIIVFGVTKALTNYWAGRFSDQYGRRPLLVLGWLIAIPVPFLLMWAPNWNWILAANALLGISQGFTWSTTVIMKIDLAGPKNRGLAMGLNEFAGYFAVGGGALATGWLASQYGLRPEPFYLGIVFAFSGLLLSVFLIRDTHGHTQVEAISSVTKVHHLTQIQIFQLTTWRDRNLSSVSQAGLVNNLNDGMAWGLFPIVFASAGMSLSEIGLLAALYPIVWGISQLYFGALSDRIGRKGLIVSGMAIQGLGICLTATVSTFNGFIMSSLLLGLGTAMVHPTLLAAISDEAHPAWRATAVGVYRLWRDLGYAFGALLAGITADLFGIVTAIWVVAMLTFLSGIIAQIRMSETLIKPKHS
jgi:MFS family permease